SYAGEIRGGKNSRPLGATYAGIDRRCGKVPGLFLDSDSLRCRSFPSARHRRSLLGGFPIGSLGLAVIHRFSVYFGGGQRYVGACLEDGQFPLNFFHELRQVGNLLPDRHVIAMAGYLEPSQWLAAHHQRDLRNPQVVVFQGLVGAVPTSMVSLVNRRCIHVEVECLQIQLLGAYRKRIPKLLPIRRALQADLHGPRRAVTGTGKKRADRGCRASMNSAWPNSLTPIRMPATVSALTTATSSLLRARLASAPTTVSEQKKEIHKSALRIDSPRLSKRWWRWPRSVV